MSTTSICASDVAIPAGARTLPGALALPEKVSGLVLFAHGSGSSRHSPRNQFVAGVLQEAGIGTLLFDLLSEPEAEDRRNVFDIELLADRLLAALRWAMSSGATSALAMGLFGASTGAAAALVAAGQEPLVRAVVSRGGRPDLAGAWLGRVAAPTLLIVGERDRQVLELNRRALAQLQCEKRLSVVPGATHLFEEPGTLEQASQLAKEWFSEHLAKGGAQ
jgi:putative phosphoribosyl transferase